MNLFLVGLHLAMFSVCSKFLFFIPLRAPENLSIQPVRYCLDHSLIKCSSIYIYASSSPIIQPIITNKTAFTHSVYPVVYKSTENAIIKKNSLTFCDFVSMLRVTFYSKIFELQPFSLHAFRDRCNYFSNLHSSD